MKYHFNAENHASTCVMSLVNGFNSANLSDIAIGIAGTSYYCCQDSPGVSYGYSAGIIVVLHCIIAVFCIFIILGAIFVRKMNSKKNKSIGNLIYNEFCLTN